MKITKSQLKQIIREELESVFLEGAADRLKDMGPFSDTSAVAQVGLGSKPKSRMADKRSARYLKRVDRERRVAPQKKKVYRHAMAVLNQQEDFGENLGPALNRLADLRRDDELSKEVNNLVFRALLENDPEEIKQAAQDLKQILGI